MAFRDNTENKRRFNKLRSYLGDNFGNRLLKEILSELEKEDDISIQTYDSLKATKENNQLVAGKKYLMSDFQTIHIIPNTVDENTVQDSDTFYARGASQAGASSLTTANLTLAIKNIGEPLGFGFSLGNIDVSAGNNYGKAEIIAGIKANFLDLFHPEGNADLEMFVSVDASDNLNATLKTSTDFDLDLREYIEVSGSGFTLQWGTFETVEAWQPEIEPLILTAISESEFDAKVQSSLYPQDSIWYDINNSAWGDYESPNSKGFIYRRIDNEKAIDICYDFRNVRYRRWNCDLSNYTGVSDDYCLFNTTVNIGREYDGSGATSFIAKDLNDYKDFVTINADPVNFTITSRTTLANVVCLRNVENTQIALADKIHFARGIVNSNVNFCNNLMIMNTAYTGGATLATTLESNFILNSFACLGGYADAKLGLLVNTSIHPRPSGFTNSCNLSGDSIISGVENGCIRFDSTSSATHFNSLMMVNIQSAWKFNDLYIDIVGKAPNKTVFTNSIYDAKVTYQDNSTPLKITETFSNLEYTVAATTNIARDTVVPSDVCGVYNLTGSGIVVIASIVTGSNVKGQARADLLLKPESGLTVQIANSDVTDGILTNGLTYEANGTNGEFIKVAWDVSLQRYIVLSGRTTP